MGPGTWLVVHREVALFWAQASTQEQADSRLRAESLYGAPFARETRCRLEVPAKQQLPVRSGRGGAVHGSEHSPWKEATLKACQTAFSVGGSRTFQRLNNL